MADGMTAPEYAGWTVSAVPHDSQPTRYARAELREITAVDSFSATWYSGWPARYSSFFTERHLWTHRGSRTWVREWPGHLISVTVPRSSGPRPLRINGAEYRRRARRR